MLRRSEARRSTGIDASCLAANGIDRAAAALAEAAPPELDPTSLRSSAPIALEIDGPGAQPRTFAKAA